jgi:hypothetical protein
MPRERDPSRDLIEDDAIEPLPARTYATALDIHLGMQKTRIERLYNRTRAVFAESIVAALLPGAVLIEDPAAAWDVSWQPPRRARPIRIQVKCSGERLPKFPGRRTPAKWDFEPPKSGWDPDAQVGLSAGHHCDVLVLARHRGDDIAGGWSFFVMRPDGIRRMRRVTPRHLAAAATRYEASSLATVVRRVAAGPPT